MWPLSLESFKGKDPKFHILEIMPAPEIHLNIREIERYRDSLLLIIKIGQSHIDIQSLWCARDFSEKKSVFVVACI